MKKVLIVGASLMAFVAAPAMAADLGARIPLKAPMMAPVAFSWTGCYVGGFAGGAAGARDIRSTDLNGYNGPDSWNYDIGSSFIGGGTLGCNYQTGQFVFGLEGEAGYMKLRGTAVDPLSPFIPLDTFASTALGDWYGMITGRAGIAFDRTLFYAKGGAAFVKSSTSVIDANPAGGNTIAASGGSTRATWTVGGGIEYAFTQNWTVKGEYMYIGLRGSDTACGVAAVGGGRFCWSEDQSGIHTAKIGINYLFNAGPVVARY